MTSDREDRRVRRGHAWAREAQDFAPRHAQASLPPRTRPSPVSHPLFLPLFSSLEGQEGDPRALPPFSLALSPRNSARLAGVMPARSSACIMYRVKWRMERRTVVVLCIHFAFLLPSSFPRNDQDLPMIFNAGSATSAGPACRSYLTRFVREITAETHITAHIRLLPELFATFLCTRGCHDLTTPIACNLIRAFDQISLRGIQNCHRESLADLNRRRVFNGLTNKISRLYSSERSYI